MFVPKETQINYNPIKKKRQSLFATRERKLQIVIVTVVIIIMMIIMIIITIIIAII